MTSDGYGSIGKISAIDGYYIYVQLSNQLDEKIEVERYEHELELVGEYNE